MMCTCTSTNLWTTKVCKVKFGALIVICQICQCFPPSKFCTVWYIIIILCNYLFIYMRLTDEILISILPNFFDSFANFSWKPLLSIPIALKSCEKIIVENVKLNAYLTKLKHHEIINYDYSWQFIIYNIGPS